MIRHGINAAKALVTPGVLFEGLGFHYVGPVDGHDVLGLVETFQKLAIFDDPVLLHAVTTKGKGYHPAESDTATRGHGLSFFDVATGKPVKKAARQGLHRPLRRGALRRDGGATTGWWPSPRPCWRGPGSSRRSSASRTGPTTSASPSSTRSPSRPAWPARGSGRWWPSTRPSCSGPTTRSSTTWRCRSCRSPSRSTAAAWWAPTARRTRAPSTSPTCAACPTSSVMAPSDENELRHMLHTAAAPRRPRGLPVPARRRRGRRGRAAPAALEIGKGRLVRNGPGQAGRAAWSRWARPCKPALAAAEALARRRASPRP